MWRAYSDDSGRYSIGFDRNQLEYLVMSQNHLRDKADGFLLECFYLYPNDAYLDKLAADLRQFSSFTQNNNLPSAGTAASIKHKGFEMEYEWRIIFVDKGDALAGEVEFRQGKSQIVPFIRVKWKNENFAKLIKRIVVGPTPNKEDAIKSVEMLLKKYGILVMGDDAQLLRPEIGRTCIPPTSESCPDTVEVASSQIPYRNW